LHWHRLDQLINLLASACLKAARLRQVGFLLSLVALWWGLFGAACPAEAARLSEIKHRGYLIVGVKDNLRPLGFQEQGQLQGLEIDIARQLASELLGDATDVEFKPLLNQDRLKALLDDQVDILIARMTVTDTRMRLIDFSNPYFVDGTAFLTRDNAIQRLSDLHDQPVAVLLGSDTISAVRSLMPRVQLQGANSYEEAKLLLDDGQVVAFAADSALLTGWAQEDSSYRLLTPLISADALAIAIPKGRQYRHLHQQVNRALTGWLASGWLKQRILDWGLPEDGFPGLPRSEGVSSTSSFLWVGAAHPP
jgi:polar amino acid transport system substrate-binding protein